MIKRKTKRRSSELAELDRASREIESRIQELEASLKRPSQQTRMRLDRNTMPPPDLSLIHIWTLPTILRV